jgi:hypothetical protein
MTKDEFINEIKNLSQGMSDDQMRCVLNFAKYLTSGSKDVEGPDSKFKYLYKESHDDPSYAEVGLFYISIALALCTIIWPTTFLAKIHLFGLESAVSVFLIPTFFWIFLRASRKDMNATSHLIAAGMGALGGALVTILTKH